MSRSVGTRVRVAFTAVVTAAVLVLTVSPAEASATRSTSAKGHSVSASAKVVFYNPFQFVVTNFGVSDTYCDASPVYAEVWVLWSYRHSQAVMPLTQYYNKRGCGTRKRMPDVGKNMDRQVLGVFLKACVDSVGTNECTKLPQRFRETKVAYNPYDSRAPK